MISVLREVVGADFLAAVAAADHAEAAGFLRGLLLFDFRRQQAGAENVHGFQEVLELGALILAGDDHPGGLVDQADGGFVFLDVLAARALREGVLTDNIFGIDLDVHFLGYWASRSR